MSIDPRIPQNSPPYPTSNNYSNTSWIFRSNEYTTNYITQLRLLKPTRQKRICKPTPIHMYTFSIDAAIGCLVAPKLHCKMTPT